MPIDWGTVVAIVGGLLAVATYSKTRRVGPVISVALAAFIVMAIADPTVLNTGKDFVANGLNYVIELVQF